MIAPERRNKPFIHERLASGAAGLPPIPDQLATDRGVMNPGRTAMISFEQDFLDLPIAASGVTGWKVDNDGALTTALGHVAAGVGGSALFAPGSTATNNAHYQWANNSTILSPFTITSGKRLWLSSRFKCEDVDKNLPIIGLHTSQTDPWNTEPADQFLFRSLTSDGVLQFACGTTNSTEKTITLNTMADNTFYNVLAFYDGDTTAAAWVWNDSWDLLASGIADQSTTYRPDGAMTVAFGMEMVDTGADDMTIDHIHVFMER